MGLEINYSGGQTPLEEDEKADLLIRTITTLSDLNEYEQLNIEEARKWLLKSRLDLNKIVTEDFILKLHSKMFGKVWRWAGKYRRSNKNIGVDKFEIRTQLRYLLDNTKFWIDNNTFSPDEISIRFSHRLVQIHLFPNGNGRHSRLIGDILINRGFGLEEFTWGSTNLTSTSDSRTAYLEALRKADDNDFSDLITFARS